MERLRTRASWYDPLEIWKAWADDVTGDALDAGHFLPEKAPDLVIARLEALLGGGNRPND